MMIEMNHIHWLSQINWANNN